MKKALLTGLAFIFVILNSCENSQSDTPQIVELRINHYQVTANGPFQGLFHLTQSGEEIGGENWSIHYAPIENFDFEWGYTYKILVEIKKRKEKNGQLPMDSSAYRYIFLEEVSKTRVNEGSTFEILLQRAYDDGGIGNYVQGDLEKGFTLLGVIPFHCVDFCNELFKGQNSNTTLTGTFEHTDGGDIKLIGLKKQGN